MIVVGTSGAIQLLDLSTVDIRDAARHWMLMFEYSTGHDLDLDRLLNFKGRKVSGRTVGNNKVTVELVTDPSRIYELSNIERLMHKEFYIEQQEDKGASMDGLTVGKVIEELTGYPSTLGVYTEPEYGDSEKVTAIYYDRSLDRVIIKTNAEAL